jgi:hypothetical protein
LRSPTTQVTSFAVNMLAAITPQTATVVARKRPSSVSGVYERPVLMRSRPPKAQ